MAITETWLNIGILDGEILPKTYIMYRNDRTSRGGGVMLAVNTELSSRQLFSCNDIEAIAVQIDCGRSFIVCVIYVPPTADDTYHQHLSDVLFSLSSLNKDLLVLGDFNFPDIDWELLSGTSKHSINFCNLTLQLNMCQLVVSPTHRAGNILDLVITTNDELVQDIVIHHDFPPGLSSDHFIITLRVPVSHVNRVRSPHQSFFNYSKANWEEMNAFFGEYNFDEFYGKPNLEQAWTCFKEIILTAIPLFVPRVCSRRHPRPKWFN